MASRSFRIGCILLVAACGDDVPAGGGTDGSSTTADSMSPSTTASTTGMSTTTPSTTTSDDASSSSGDGSTGTDGGTTAVTDATAPTSGDTTTGDGSTGSSGSEGESSSSGEEEEQIDCPPSTPDTTLTGTVWGPNGVIPVANALVYTSQNRPDGIPQEVYCAACEHLQCDDVATFTASDGTFTLNTNAAEAKYLIVQKGQFMRITPLSIGAGSFPVDATLTTLPDHNDPNNGLYIPLIAVGDGSFDRLEDALGKFGLGDTTISFFEERLVPGTEPFDLWDNGRNPATDGFLSQGTFDQLVSDPDRLAEYHVIFVPCSADDYVGALADDDVVDNIREWVAAGGRWYVADWANEWMGQTFPEYQTFQGGNFGGGDLGVYDSLADVLDPGLLAWLEALPDDLKDINPLNNEEHPTLYDLPQVQTVDNWSAIIATPQVLVPDGMGGQVDVGHKVWLEGPGLGLGVHPLTVTGQYGCGKIQFTSYHTAEFFNYVGLSPQELALFYTILEIGVCQTPVDPV